MMARIFCTNFSRVPTISFIASTDLVRAAARSGKIPTRPFPSMACSIRSTNFWLSTRSRCISPTSLASDIMRATSGSAFTHLAAVGGTNTPMSNLSRLLPTSESK